PRMGGSDPWERSPVGYFAAGAVSLEMWCEETANGRREPAGSSHTSRLTPAVRRESLLGGGFRGLGGLGDLLLRDLDQLVERGRVVDRDLGQGLAVEGDVGQLQAVHERAVPDVAHPAGGVDADDPQAAELPLAVAAVAIGEHARPDEGHDR